MNINFKAMYYLVIVLAVVLYIAYVYINKNIRLKKARRVNPLDMVILYPEKETRMVYKNTGDGYLWLFGDINAFSRFEKVSITRIKPLTDERNRKVCAPDYKHN